MRRFFFFYRYGPYYLILLLFGVFLFVRFCFVFVSFHLFSPSETKVGLMKKGLYFCWILLCKMWTNRTF